MDEVYDEKTGVWGPPGTVTDRMFMADEALPIEWSKDQIIEPDDSDLPTTSVSLLASADDTWVSDTEFKRHAFSEILLTRVKGKIVVVKPARPGSVKT